MRRPVRRQSEQRRWAGLEGAGSSSKDGWMRAASSRGCPSGRRVQAGTAGRGTVGQIWLPLPDPFMDDWPAMATVSK
ncbi:hypothetical protein ACP70R_016437 [Stipagrostis hirtigluma subsp. patula]